MPIYEDEAIVLRQYPIAESDGIVVCIAPGLGKIRAVAQGLKKLKNRFSGCLEPFNHINIVYYIREGRDLGKVRHAELIHSYSGKISSLNHIIAFTYFAELANAFVQENQSNPTVFRLLKASLKAGEKLAPVQPLVRYFEVWCLKLSGLFPNYGYCSDCGKCVKQDNFWVRLKEAAAYCETCSSRRGIFIGEDASRALGTIAIRSPEDFASIPLTEEADRQLEQLTVGLLGLNLENPLKSYSILREALRKDPGS